MARLVYGNYLNVLVTHKSHTLLDVGDRQRLHKQEESNLLDYCSALLSATMRGLPAMVVALVCLQLGVLDYGASGMEGSGIEEEGSAEYGES